MMEWDDLRVFLAVYRTKSLTSAGRMLNQSQPTVGRRLTALEGSINQKLFHRGSGGFLLTEAGAAVLVYAERIEEEVLKLERTIMGTEKTFEGRIKVASLDWFGIHFLAPLFIEFQKSWPGIEIELLTSPQPASLSRREADVAFRVIQFTEADVIQNKIMHVPFGLYSNRELPRPVQSKANRIRIITMNSEFDDLEDAVWLRRKFPEAKAVFRSNNRAAHLKMCAAGLGYALLPVALAEHEPRLVQHRFRECPPGKDIWLGYHRDLSKLTRIQELVSFAKAKATKKN